MAEEKFKGFICLVVGIAILTNAWIATERADVVVGGSKGSAVKDVQVQNVTVTEVSDSGQTTVTEVGIVRPTTVTEVSDVGQTANDLPLVSADNFGTKRVMGETVFAPKDERVIAWGVGKVVRFVETASKDVVGEIQTSPETVVSEVQTSSESVVGDIDVDEKQVFVQLHHEKINPALLLLLWGIGIGLTIGGPINYWRKLITIKAE